MEFLREAVCRLCWKEKVSDMECAREAVCRLCWKEKVSDMDVMEKAMRMGENGQARWQMEAAV